MSTNGNSSNLCINDIPQKNIPRPAAPINNNNNKQQNNASRALGSDKWGARNATFVWCYYSFPWICGIMNVVFILGTLIFLVVDFLFNFSWPPTLQSFKNYLYGLRYSGPVLLASFIVMSAIFLGVYIWLRKKRKQVKLVLFQRDETAPLLQTNVVVTSPLRETEFSIPIDEDGIVLGQPIGEGSYATVFKGNWLGTTVAVKRSLLPTGEAKDEVIKRFVDESSMMSSLKHPHIVQFLGTTVQPPYFYIITEFCEHGSLHSIVHERKIPLTMEMKWCMALDIARGMLYLHSAFPPIVHRDLKLGNLLVDSNWNVKVGDFGLSRYVEYRETMTACGTYTTSAPEVLSGMRYTETADVYSYACVLWELMSGEVLYKGMNIFQVSVQVVNQRMRPPLKPEFPKFLSDFMVKCWDHEPHKRPPFKEIVPMLENYINSMGYKKSPPGSSTTTATATATTNKKRAASVLASSRAPPAAAAAPDTSNNSNSHHSNSNNNNNNDIYYPFPNRPFPNRVVVPPNFEQQIGRFSSGTRAEFMNKRSTL